MSDLFMITFAFITLVPLCLFGSILLYAWLKLKALKSKGEASIRKTGRLIGQEELRQRLKSSGGTLILEMPTLGWPFFRLWWTQDNIPTRIEELGLSTASYNEEYGYPSESECWLNDSYTDLKTGTASLVEIKHSGKKVITEMNNFCAQFKNVARENVRSAMVEFYRFSLNAEAGNKDGKG